MGHSDKFNSPGSDQLEVDLLGFLKLLPQLLLLHPQLVVDLLQLSQLSDLIHVFRFLVFSIVTAPEHTELSSELSELSDFYLETFF